MKDTRPLIILGITLLVIILGINFFAGENSAKRSYIDHSTYTAPQPAQVDDIYSQVCRDAVDQYEIAARQGDKMQMYVQAGFCSAAFLQAKDEVNYRKWKDIEKKHAQQIGIRTY